MFKDSGKAPPALVNNLRHNKVLHENTLIVSVDTADAPRVDAEERATVTRVEPGVYQVRLEFGFMEEPDVPAALALIEHRGPLSTADDVTYFLGREIDQAGKAPGMHPLRRASVRAAEPRRRQRQPLLQPARRARVRGRLHVEKSSYSP